MSVSEPDKPTPFSDTWVEVATLATDRALRTSGRHLLVDPGTAGVANVDLRAGPRGFGGAEVGTSNTMLNLPGRVQSRSETAAPIRHVSC